MSVVTFQTVKNFPHVPVSAGDGTFDVARAVALGDGVFTVDSSHSQLVRYLRSSYPGVVERTDVTLKAANFQRRLADPPAQPDPDVGPLLTELQSLRAANARLTQQAVQTLQEYRKCLASLASEQDKTHALEETVEDLTWRIRLMKPSPKKTQVLQASPPPRHSMRLGALGIVSPAYRPPNPSVTYQVLPGIDITTLIGATTSEPPDQEMLSILPLIQSAFPGELIGTALPISLGSDPGGRTITVEEGSPEDEALQGFSQLVQRIPQ